MRRIAIAVLAALSLSACGLVPLITGIQTAPPTSSALASTSIDESAIDFARDSFDAALFGVDALMDMGKIKPGSPEARNLAKLIRQIAGFLGAADSAQKAGQASTYNEAFRNAKAALAQFRTAIGIEAKTGAILDNAAQSRRLAGASFTSGQRLALARALETRN